MCSKIEEIEHLKVTDHAPIDRYNADNVSVSPRQVPRISHFQALPLSKCSLWWVIDEREMAWACVT